MPFHLYPQPPSHAIATSHCDPVQPAAQIHCGCGVTCVTVGPNVNNNNPDIDFDDFNSTDHFPLIIPSFSTLATIQLPPGDGLALIPAELSKNLGLELAVATGPDITVVNLMHVWTVVNQTSTPAAMNSIGESSLNTQQASNPPTTTTLTTTTITFGLTSATVGPSPTSFTRPSPSNVEPSYINDLYGQWDSLRKDFALGGPSSGVDNFGQITQVPNAFDPLCATETITTSDLTCSDGRDPFVADPTEYPIATPKSNAASIGIAAGVAVGVVVIVAMIAIAMGYTHKHQKCCFKKKGKGNKAHHSPTTAPFKPIPFFSLSITFQIPLPLRQTPIRALTPLPIPLGASIMVKLVSITSSSTLP